jgi:hypothetical protein
MLRLLKLSMWAALILATIGALGTVAAQAGTFTAGAYPATVKSSGGADLFFTETASISILCLPKPDGTLAGGSVSLTLTPNYGTSCKSEEKAVHVNENGCDLRFRAGLTQEPDVVSGTMDVVCPLGKAIDFEITPAPVCHYFVLPQENKAVFSYRNRTAEKSIQWEAGVNELVYRLSGSCPEGAGEYFNGVYLGNGTMRATKEGFSTAFFVE